MDKIRYNRNKNIEVDEVETNKDKIIIVPKFDSLSRLEQLINPGLMTFKKKTQKALQCSVRNKEKMSIIKDS